MTQTGRVRWNWSPNLWNSARASPSSLSRTCTRLAVPAAARHVPGPADDPAAHGEPPRRRPALGRGPARARRGASVERASTRASTAPSSSLSMIDSIPAIGLGESIPSLTSSRRRAAFELSSRSAMPPRIRCCPNSRQRVHLERDAHARRDLRRDRGRDDHRAVQVLRQRYPAPFRTVQVLRWRALDNAGTRARHRARARARALPPVTPTTARAPDPAPHSTDMV